MPLKYFLLAALTILMLLLAYVLTGVYLLYNGHPKIADAMNVAMAVGIIWYFGKTEA